MKEFNPCWWQCRPHMGTTWVEDAELDQGWYNIRIPGKHFGNAVSQGILQDCRSGCPGCRVENKHSSPAELIIVSSQTVCPSCFGRTRQSGGLGKKKFFQRALPVPFLWVATSVSCQYCELPLLPASTIVVAHYYMLPLLRTRNIVHSEYCGLPILIQIRVEMWILAFPTGNKTKTPTKKKETIRT